MKIILGTYRFSVSGDFFVWVFCSTPKNKRVFACGPSFGHKYARYDGLAQSIEHQWLTFGDYFSALQYAPFRHVIQPVSGSETHNITPWNRREQRPKRALLECQTHHPAFHYGISDNSVWSERAFPMSDLHFLNSLLRFYFVKIKSRKIVSPPSEFSLKVSI